MAKVAIESVNSKIFTNDVINDTVGLAIHKLNYDFSNVKSVIIKPNLCYYWNASTGETTDGRVVSAIINFLRNKIGQNVDITVAEADASAMKTKFAFDILGYTELCRKNNVKLLNLSEGKISDMTVKVNGGEITLPFNDDLLNADLIVNVPKLKTHNFVGMTCSLKNIFGAIAKPRKFSYHKNINNTIVAANKIVKPQINVVDGLIVRGSHPTKLGVVLAGDNALSTDFIAARIMSFNPRRVPHLSLAEKEKLGETRTISLVEDGITLAAIKKKFPHYNYTMHAISWGLQLKVLRTYTTVSGDVLPPFLAE